MNKLVPRASKGDLNKFLRSNKVILPKTIGLYTRGSIKQDLCPFCDNGHDNNTIMYRPKINAPLSILLNTYSCDYCTTVIQESDSKPNMDKLFEEFALSSGSATLAKIDGVVYDGTFPDNAHHYYTHIDSDEAPFKVKSDNCFYCNSYVGNSHSQGFIDPEGIAVEHIIPTGFEQYSIDGGHVKICKSCNLILGSKLQDTYMSHLLSFCGLDVCRKCGDQYLVTNSEIDARNAAQTFGKHMCPECCYTTLAYDERLMNYEGDNLFAPYSKIIRDGDHKINRYYAQECYYCSEPIGIDLSVHPEETVKRFVSSQGHFTCEECMFRDNSPIKVLNKKDIIIRVYEINNKFYIKKTSVGGKILSFHTSLDSDTALDLLLNEYDDRQLKLI